MKLELDADEYLHLLYMANITDAVLHTYEDEERPDTEGFLKLFQKIRAGAEEAGHGGLIDRDPQSGDYYESAKFDGESPTPGFIEEYNENTFWGEITARLGLRDADRAEGEERLRRMEMEEITEVIERYEEKWAKEWEQHGLMRLGVVSAPMASGKNKRH